MATMVSPLVALRVFAVVAKVQVEVVPLLLAGVVLSPRSVLVVLS